MSAKIQSRWWTLTFVLLLTSCDNPYDVPLGGSGTIEATEVRVGAMTAGQIISLRVSEGDQVTAGDTLAIIDAEMLTIKRRQAEAGLRELAANVEVANRKQAQARIQFENTRRRHARIKSLFENKTATQQQMDDVQSALDLARSQLSVAKTSLQALEAKRDQIQATLDLLDRQIRDASLRAPIGGTIISKYVEAGELVGLGAPVATIANLSRMWVKVYVSEEDLGRVKVGQAAKLNVDSFPDRALDGRVVWISPIAEFTPKSVQTRESRVNLVYAVKVEAGNPKGILKIGMPVDVELE